MEAEDPGLIWDIIRIMAIIVVMTAIAGCISSPTADSTAGSSIATMGTTSGPVGIPPNSPESIVTDYFRYLDSGQYENAMALCVDYSIKPDRASLEPLTPEHVSMQKESLTDLYGRTGEYIKIENVQIEKAPLDSKNQGDKRVTEAYGISVTFTGTLSSPRNTEYGLKTPVDTRTYTKTGVIVHMNGEWKLVGAL